jgi:FkbM family methyltransferase
VGRDPDRFLSRVAGVIHIGANTGQERDVYRKHGLNVFWIEPIPEIFKVLERNLDGYSKQRAAQYLLSARDRETFKLNIANNDGASSSILELNAHRDLWPAVHFTSSLEIQSRTLDAVLIEESIDRTQHDSLVIDTQGSELLVLKGAEESLSWFRYIKTEAADFEAYSGCSTLVDLDDFLHRRGFRRAAKAKFAGKPGVGNYFDVLYERRS